jgi:uncharacterized membrane protein (UPF0127 family)
MQIEKCAQERQSPAMMIWRLSRCLVLLALLGVGCGSADRPQGSTNAAVAPASTAKTNVAPQVDLPTKAQPKLRTMKLWLGSEEITAELAAAKREIETGMMFRTEIGENEGMLFIFPGPYRVAFWMKNCVIPLSCAYIDSEGVILETREMKAGDETPLTAKSDRVQYVLEVKHGWFERHNVTPGMVVRTERGSLMQTFFSPR